MVDPGRAWILTLLACLLCAFSTSFWIIALFELVPVPSYIRTGPWWRLRIYILTAVSAAIALAIAVRQWRRHAGSRVFLGALALISATCLIPTLVFAEDMYSEFWALLAE